jgi:hypothetical protein
LFNLQQLGNDDTRESRTESPCFYVMRYRSKAGGRSLNVPPGSTANPLGQNWNLVKKKDRATVRQQQRLEFQAAKRVVTWTRLSRNDYNFRSWGENGGKELLRAGCVYEYARESRKLRCLLVLINLAFQKARQAEKTHSRPPFEGLGFLSLSFKGLRYRDALLGLWGWFGWLRKFTDQLADNKSFADLYKKTKRK